MAKKKQTPAELLAKQGMAKQSFVGGPRNGTVLQMQLKPLRYMRFAFPEWCTYEWDPTEVFYRYVGPEPPPAQDHEAMAPPPREHYIPDPEPALHYRQTAAYRRGRELAGEVVAPNPT